MRRVLFLALVAVAIWGTPARGKAFEDFRLSIGMKFQFMPTGSFSLRYSDEHMGGKEISSASAIPALGFSPFVDYWLNHYVALGFGADLLLNVIPDVTHYNVGHMLGLGGRLKLAYPLSRRWTAYGLLFPSYTIIFNDLLDNPSGFSLTGLGGVSFRLSQLNAAFVELGYAAGFQQRDVNGAAESYAPSYLVTSIGWSANF